MNPNQTTGLEADQRLTPEAMGQLSVIMKSAKEATHSLTTAVRELDAKERAISERLSEIETAPPTRKEFVSYAKACLTQQAVEWRRDLATAFAGGFAGHQITPLEIAVSRDAVGVETLKTSKPVPLNLLVGDPAKPGAVFESSIGDNPVTGRMMAGILADLIAPRLEKILNEIELPFSDAPEIPLADRAAQIARLRGNLVELRRQRAELVGQIEEITADKLESMKPDRL